MSQETFAALGVSAELTAALAERGITTPFQIQTRAIPPALAGTDLLAKSPTGSGKTLAFALPLVARVPLDDARPAALVLVPTRELALQVTEEIAALGRARGVNVAAVYGGVSLRPQANAARDAHIVVATPGRLQDLLDRRLITLDAVELLVLDEADRMLDMGFKPQVDRIVKRLPRERQTMFFSATLDGEVGELARAYTQSPVRIEAALPTEHAPGEIDHRFVPVTQEGKLDTLIELLEGERGLALVFVRTKRGADRLARRLEQRGVRAAAMHGDLNQANRQRALERFES
jgi:superfamily II DNA/RNA helicase